jgi:hypothetical protein
MNHSADPAHDRPPGRRRRPGAASARPPHRRAKRGARRCSTADADRLHRLLVEPPPCRNHPGRRDPKRLDQIEARLIGLKLPGSFADQVYLLRQHITFVRARLH